MKNLKRSQNQPSQQVNGIKFGKVFLPLSPLGLYVLPGGVQKSYNALYYDEFLKSNKK